MKTAAALSSLLVLLSTASCRSGSSFTAGDAVTINTVNRTYEFSTGMVWQAVTDTIKDLGLVVDQDAHDALGGELVARRANNEKVVIHTRSMNPKNTIVSVAVDPGDRNLAEVIQGHISERLRAAK